MRRLCLVTPRWSEPPLECSSWFDRTASTGRKAVSAVELDLIKIVKIFKYVPHAAESESALTKTRCQMAEKVTRSITLRPLMTLTSCSHESSFIVDLLSHPPPTPSTLLADKQRARCQRNTCKVASFRPVPTSNIQRWVFREPQRIGCDCEPTNVRAPNLSRNLETSSGYRRWGMSICKCSYVAVTDPISIFRDVWALPYVLMLVLVVVGFIFAFGQRQMFWMWHTVFSEHTASLHY